MERHEPQRLTVAPATAHHMPGVRAIAGSYGNLGDWPDRPDYLDFELRERALWVALEDGVVVGFAGVVRSGARTHLADLFIARARRGEGIGALLLTAALPRDGLRTTFASGDERALPLYIRAGLVPLAPLLYLEGEPAGDGAVRRVPVRAIGRSPALDFLAEAGATALIAGSAHAVVRAAPGGACLGPAAADRPEDLLAVARAATAEYGGVKLAIPGPHPALGPLVRAGLRIVAGDTWMASGPGGLDLERELPDADLG